MSKRAGAVSKLTKESIIDAAKQEFYEHGFQGTSLRKICTRAGVTTGALYFFFQGKDDVFDTILTQITTPFLELMDAHYTFEKDRSNRKTKEGEEEDYNISKLLIEFYFKNKKSWDILLHNQNHPYVQTFLDYFIDISTQHYMYLLQQETDAFAVHQFVHMQVDTMLNLISHDFDQEEMIEHSKVVTKMLRGAFQVLMEE